MTGASLVRDLSFGSRIDRADVNQLLTAFGDMLIVASNGSELRAPDWSVTQSPGFLEDFCRVIIPTPDALEATRVSHRRALAPLLDAWNQANSDFYPTVDLLAERTREHANSPDAWRAYATLLEQEGDTAGAQQARSKMEALLA